MALLPVFKDGLPLFKDGKPAFSELPCGCCGECVCPNPYEPVPWASILLESTGACTFRGTLFLDPPQNITIISTAWATTDISAPNDIVAQTPTTIDLQQDLGGCDAVINTITYEETSEDPSCPVKTCTVFLWECYACCANFTSCVKNIEKTTPAEPWCVGGPGVPIAFLLELEPYTVNPSIEPCFPCDVISPLILDRLPNTTQYRATVSVPNWTVPANCSAYPQAVGLTNTFSFVAEYNIGTNFGCESRLEMETNWIGNGIFTQTYSSDALHFGGLPSMHKTNVRIFNVNTPNSNTCHYVFGQPDGFGDIRLTPIWE